MCVCDFVYFVYIGSYSKLSRKLVWFHIYEVRERQRERECGRGILLHKYRSHHYIARFIYSVNVFYFLQHNCVGTPPNTKHTTKSTNEQHQHIFLFVLWTQVKHTQIAPNLILLANKLSFRVACLYIYIWPMRVLLLFFATAKKPFRCIFFSRKTLQIMLWLLKCCRFRGDSRALSLNCPERGQTQSWE